MALAYTRVSTFRQGENGTSLDEQANIIRRYAAVNHIRIRQIISEIISGDKNDSFMNVNSNNFKHFIFADVSRFSRNVSNGIRMTEQIINSGIQIHFVRNELIMDRDMTENTWLRFIRLLNNSADELLQISQRVRAVKEYKRSRGEHAGGLVPYGLTTVGLSKKYVLDEQAVSVIQFIELCRSQNYTMRQLNEAMSKCIGRRCRDIRLYDRNLVDGYYIYEERKTNTESMSYGDIANLLNEYGLSYKGTPFTSAKICRIRSLETINSLVVEDDIVEDFDDLQIIEPGMDCHDDPDYVAFLKFQHSRRRNR